METSQAKWSDRGGDYVENKYVISLLDYLCVYVEEFFHYKEKKDKRKSGWLFV